MKRINPAASVDSTSDRNVYQIVTERQGDEYPLMWVWSLRGKPGTVDQELRQNHIPVCTGARTRGCRKRLGYFAQAT